MSEELDADSVPPDPSSETTVRSNRNRKRSPRSSSALGLVVVLTGAIPPLYFLDVLPPTLAVILLVLAVFATLDAVGPINLGGVDREAQRTRERINREAGHRIQFNAPINGTLNIDIPVDASDEATARTSESLRKQEELLFEIYTQGLAQAKVSFRISVFFAAIGASLLLVGVGLSVARASTDGEKYSTIVAGVAGVVTNLISGVFFLQSNRARKNMGEQGVMMREESQEDRRVNMARELAASISDEDLRNGVRADLARHLVAGSAGNSVTESPANVQESAPSVEG